MSRCCWWPMARSRKSRPPKRTWGFPSAPSQRGIELLVELAELLQARVQDQRLRMNFPSAHPLYGNPGVLPMNPNVSDADVLLGLEAQDVWNFTHKMTPLNRFGMESHSVMK